MQIHHYEQVNSTNDVADTLFQKGEVGPFAVMAKTQSEGRGTKQRSWVSQEGGLYISIVCPWTSTAQSLAEALKEPGVLPYWHISVAIMLRDLIQDLAPSERPLIKWPNDIYLGTEKCAGILMQACLANATRPEEAVIVGIGLNLNQEQFPSDVPATSLRLKTQECYNTNTVADALTDKFQGSLSHEN